MKEGKKTQKVRKEKRKRGKEKDRKKEWKVKRIFKIPAVNGHMLTNHVGVFRC